MTPTHSRRVTVCQARSPADRLSSRAPGVSHTPESPLDFLSLPKVGPDPEGRAQVTVAGIKEQDKVFSVILQ